MAALRFRDLPIGMRHPRPVSAPPPVPAPERPASLRGGNGQPAPYTEQCEPCGRRTLGVLWCMACGVAKPAKPGVTSWP